MDTIVHALIEQCRFEIAAGWVQVRAAREILERSRWLLARWDTQRRAYAAADARRMPERKPAHGGRFIPMDAH